MSSVTEYKYDVAFSFLAQDENLVCEINKLISSKLNTFVYSERQKELAGKDGEEAFSKVFFEEARVVVVLYRKEWGSTTWTRIEETAIRNRAYSEGYDFTIFVPLDPVPTVPKWLPKTRLWFGFARFGLETLAGVIEAVVQQAGGTSGERTAVDEALIFVRDTNIDRQRREFLRSDVGVRAAEGEMEILANELQSMVEQIQTRTGLKLRCDKSRFKITVGSHKGSLSFEWIPTCNNMVDDAVLDVSMWDGLVNLDIGRMAMAYGTRKINSTEYNFYYIENNQRILGWRQSSGSKQFFSTRDFADINMQKLFQTLRQSISRDNRESTSFG